MSLVSGYPPQPYPAGPISHDFYSYHHQNRYQDHADAGYFQGWMLNGQNDMVMPPQSYDMGSMSTGEYSTDSNGTLYHTITTSDGHGGTIRVRCVKRRNTANKKERRRTLSINSAFANLRGCIPNVPSDTKLSKIKTLRLATSYIAYLMDILAKDDPTLTEGGFKAEISKKVETREEKRKREAEEIAAQSSSNSPQASEKKSKGRTGWPQHVWASELKP